MESESLFDIYDNITLFLAVVLDQIHYDCEKYKDKINLRNSCDELQI